MKTKPVTSLPVKSVKDILGLLGEQMEQLRPGNNPTKELVSAARASATVVNSYLGTVRLSIDGAKMSGQAPDLSFLGVIATQPSQKKQLQEAV